MKKIYDKTKIRQAVDNCSYRELLENLPFEPFLLEYEPGEMLAAPWLEHSLFQFIISGELSIRLIRDDGSMYSLADGRGDYVIGEMQFFHIKNNNIYAEVTQTLTSLAFCLNEHQEELYQNNRFLYFVGEVMARKMEALGAWEAASSSLRERVISYFKYKCEDKTLRGIEKTAFRLHCSARQLQRILNEYERDGLVVKIGKGAYRWLKETAKT